MNKKYAIKTLAEHIDAWFNREDNDCNSKGALQIGYIPDDVSERLAKICIDVLALNDAGQETAKDF